MPKDIRVNSSSFDRAMMSPYSCSSKVSNRTKQDTSSPEAGDEGEWEEVRCPICMEHPHNAVLLICSSREKGCRPYICDTSYRHSNCLDQYRESSSSSSGYGNQSHLLVCPLCRGTITGWEAMHPARKFMNSKTRNCSLETCNFIGNYSELRKHARVEHPSGRPTEASVARQSNWTMLEQHMEMEDLLAHQSDIEHDSDGLRNWGEMEMNLWSDHSFFDFPSGMSDIGDGLIDEMLSNLSFTLMSFNSSSLEEMMDSGSSRSTDTLILGSSLVENDLPGMRSNNQVENALPNSRSRSSHRSENLQTISRSRSSYHRENVSTDLRSRSSNRRDVGSTITSSRSSYHMENVPTRRRSSYYPRENGSRSRSNYHRETVHTRRRSNYYPRENGSRSRSSYRRENVPTSSRRPLGYRREYVQPSLRVRSRLRSNYDRLEVEPPVRNSANGHLSSSSRQARSNFEHREG